MTSKVLSMFVAATLAATCVFAGSDRLWSMSDPRGDDHGGGSLKYPLSPDYDRGDLDLLALTAYRQAGGTLFEATFARPVKAAKHTTIDGVGTSLDEIAKEGFYTINLDIYVDTDGVAGSGSRSTLPGRRATIDASTAWEKAICLTPDPQGARAELKRIAIRDEKRKSKAEGHRGVVSDEVRDELRVGVDDYIFFPTDVRVVGNRIQFFVPDSFLGGAASRDWAYTVFTTGADIVQRTDQQNRLLRIGDSSEALMVLPIAAGRPADRFGGGKEDDDFQPPIVDLIAPAGEKQETILSNYDADNGVPVVLKGVKP